MSQELSKEREADIRDPEHQEGRCGEWSKMAIRDLLAEIDRLRTALKGYTKCKCSIALPHLPICPGRVAREALEQK